MNKIWPRINYFLLTTFPLEKLRSLKKITGQSDKFASSFWMSFKMTNYFVILSRCISQSDYLSFVKLTLKTCQYEYAHLVNMMNFLFVTTFFFLSNWESWLVNNIMCNDQNDELKLEHENHTFAILIHISANVKVITT
jgi:hypothetical protein